MSRAQWLAAIGAIAAAGGAPASALGAQGAQATVRAYVAAVQARDAGRVCSLLDGDAFDSERSCRSLLRDELRADRLARVSVEGVLVRGAHARAVVDLVTRAGRTVEPSRARMLLRRSGGHWRVTGSGTLPGTGPYVHTRAGDDPQPAAAQALRRLADDELLALSGNGGMLCDLLAPGAPLGGHRGACWNAGFSSVHWGGGRALRLARYAEHRIGARRARLDVTIAATRAHGTRRRPGYALTTTLWRDTLHAVRAGGHWRLVKPSRAFYLAVGQPPPSDVTAPAPTATWPLDDAALPSLTQTPMPAACRVPPGLWGAHYCGQIDGLAAAPLAEGGGAVAWSRQFSTQTRTVAAGGAAGPAVTSQVASPRGDELWHVVDHGLVSVAGGALLVEEDAGTRAVRVVALDDAGRPRGPARLLDRGVSNPDDGSDPVVVTGPPKAGTAVVVLGDGTARRLAPDAGAAGPGVRLRGVFQDAAVAVLPDGTLLIAGVSGEGVGVRLLGPDGSATGPSVVQPPAAGATVMGGTPAVAVDALGHALVVWRERRGPGHVDLRGWRYDPASPTSAVPSTIARVAVPADPAADEYWDGHPAEIEVGALPDGSWSLAFGDPGSTRSPALWAARLDAAGTPHGAPRPVADRLGGAEFGGSAFAIAGDTLAWIAPPRVAGVLQVRSAAVP